MNRVPRFVTPNILPIFQYKLLQFFFNKERKQTIVILVSIA